jgi:hypothetical protein
MNIVAERVFINNDSVILTFRDYHNFVFSDSSKELFRVVSIGAIHRQSELSLYSGFRKIFERRLISGSMYKSGKKNVNLGYYDIFEKETGINDYSNEEGNYNNIWEFAMQKRQPEEFSRVQRLMNDTENKDISGIHVKYEVRDTVYRQQECYVLVKTRNVRYKNNINKNYDAKHVDIVNKTDFAIVSFMYDIRYGNGRKKYRLSTYRKSGNHYFADRFELLKPRFQSSDDRDLYTLTVGNVIDVEKDMDMYSEREFNWSRLRKIGLFVKFESMLKKSSKIDTNSLDVWNKYLHAKP